MPDNNSSDTNVMLGSKSAERKWYTIDTYMLPAKMCYLTIYAKEAVFKPYMVLFLTNTGLNPAEAGLINGLCYIGYIIGSPLWGYLADKYHNHRSLVLMLCLFSIICMCSQPFVSIGIGDKMINRCPSVNESFVTTDNANETTIANNNNKSQYSSLLFWLILSINTFALLFDGAVLGFADAGTIQRVNLNPSKTTFGRQRLYGSIGFGSGALLGSLLVSIFPTAPINCYSAVFFGYFLLVVALTFLTQWLFHGLSFKTTKHDENRNLKNRHVLKATLRQGRVIFFFMTVLVMGTEQGFYVYYTSVFLKGVKAPTMLNGICLAVGAFPCIITFAFSHRIIETFGGRWKSMCFCCFTYFIRFITMSFISNPWLILIVQPLQSFSLGLFIAAAVEHVRQISKPETLTTMYGLMNACHYAFSMIIASIAGGQIYNKYGGRLLFSCAATLSAVWTILMGIFIVFYKEEKK